MLELAYLANLFKKNIRMFYFSQSNKVLEKEYIFNEENEFIHLLLLPAYKLEVIHLKESLRNREILYNIEASNFNLISPKPLNRISSLPVDP